MEEKAHPKLSPMMDRSPLAQAKQLKFLTAFALIATIGMWANFMYYSWFADTLGWKYPDNTFQCVQVSRFSDFYFMVELNRDRDPYNTLHRPAPPAPHFLAASYPPLAELYYYGLSRFAIDYSETSTGGVRKAQDWALWIFIGIPFIAFPLLAVAWFRQSMPWLTALLVLVGFNLSYPMLFSIDRGNLELYSCILLTIFAWLANSESARSRKIAIVALGAAVALKIYPIIFVLVYLKQRRWRSVLGVCLAILILTLPCYFCLQGSFVSNVSGHFAVARDLADQVKTHIIWATHYSSSLFSLIYLPLQEVLRWEKAADWFQRHYAGLLQLSIAAVGAVVAMRTLSFARLFAAVCCLAILGTPESPDYKLLLLYPAALAIVAEGGGTRLFNLLFVSFMGLLLVPKNWVMIFTEVSYGSIANPLLVLSLMMLVLFAPSPPGRILYQPFFDFKIPGFLRRST